MKSKLSSVARVAPSELGGLFQLITRASLASGCLVGCVSEADGAREDGGTGPADAGLDAAADAQRETDADRETDSDGETSTGDSALRDGATDSAVDAGAEPYQALPCSPDSFTPMLPAPLVTTPASEYVGVYDVASNWIRPEPTQTVEYYEQVHYGAACAEADAECMRALVEAKNAQPCGDAGDAACNHVVIRRSAGVFTRSETRAQLLSLFGRIDSVAEAVLLAAFDGHTIRCPEAALSAPLRGTETFTDSQGVHIRSEYELCGTGQYRDVFLVAADGMITGAPAVKIAESPCAIGRRPEGLQGTKRTFAPRDAGSFLAACATLEAASVLAFQQLAYELSSLSAPEGMIDAAHAALVDEVRHADVVSKLARAYGATPTIPSVSATPLRSAFELACDNASEGCVRETYGALMATYQAASARNTQVRSAMQGIAADETRHAKLSWELASWLDGQLSEAERAAVRGVRDRAVAELADALDVGLAEDALAELGIPTAQVAAQLFAELRHSLWSEPAYAA